MLAAPSIFLFIFSFSSILPHSAAQEVQEVGTTQCKDTGLDWYISGVGETPCKTYERLRQICNSNYRVGNLKVGNINVTQTTPPDTCNEEVASCCCNNIAFSLSMLCLTCQQGLGTGSGINAGAGVYQAYLEANRGGGFCYPQVNKTLPADIQSAVCNQDIKIYDDLYSIFWDDGACVLASQTITKNQAANPDKMFTKCPASSSTSSTASLSSTGSPGSDGSESDRLGTGAIAGIAIGVVALVIASAVGAFFFFRRRKRTKYVDAGFSIDGSEGPPGPLPSPYPYTSKSVSMMSLASASTASHHPNHEGASSQLGGSGHGSSSTSANNLGFVVLNPDDSNSGQSGGSGSTDDPRWPPSLPGKAADPKAGMTYVPASPVSLTDTSDRHVDAGPIEGSSLQRVPSGRLPPAYGDLVRGSS
ncbi:hypothetical protein PM082_009749 [Marasmius tenuissimus]|nr:hypothetical protein PM082_009749 [Marasmius tenuissimus]